MSSRRAPLKNGQLFTENCAVKESLLGARRNQRGDSRRELRCRCTRGVQPCAHAVLMTRRRRGREDDSDDEAPSMTMAEALNEVCNFGTVSNHAQSTPGWDAWSKAVRNVWITASVDRSTADMFAKSKHSKTASPLSDSALYQMFDLVFPRGDRQRTAVRQCLLAWSTSCRRLRIILRPFLLEIALAVPWTGTYQVIGDRLPLDSKRKLIKAIGDRVELLKDTVKLNGIDAAKGPVDAKPIYAPGQIFTGLVKLEWDTLQSASDTDYCITYVAVNSGRSHSCPHPHSRSHSHSHSHPRPRSRSHTHTHTHAHTRTRRYTQTLTRSLTPTLTRSHTHTHTHAHTRTRRYTQTLTRSLTPTLTRSLTPTLTHSHTHTHAHTRTLPLTLTPHTRRYSETGRRDKDHIMQLCDRVDADQAPQWARIAKAHDLFG